MSYFVYVPFLQLQYEDKYKEYLNNVQSLFESLLREKFCYWG